MDRHKAHNNKTIINRNRNVEIIIAPANSSQFNPIEHVWQAFKIEMHKKLLKRKEQWSM